MLKVAIVCGAGIVSGKEIMAMELAKGLRDKGCKVEMITSRWGNGDFRRRLEDEKLPAHIMRLGFISATLNFECMRMTAHQMLFWPKLLMDYGRFLRKSRPRKVIHTNWHHVLLLWPFLNSERDIYWSHEVFAEKPQYRWLISALGNRISCLVAVSKAGAHSLLKLGVPEQKAILIYNGISDPVAARSIKSEDAVLTVGIVGQIGAWKGHEDLLVAFKIVLEPQPSAELHIFGRPSSEYGRFLRGRAAQLGVQRNVIWRGFIDDPAKIYGDLSVLVVPSRSEDTLPTAAIEAGFFGIPVIASDKGGLPEIVEDQVTGLLFPSGDIQQLASALKKLLNDSILREDMGRNARSRVVRKFSRDRFIGDFFRLLEAA
jgi:glycosyltransferase involved in cell wall biosynthesis